MEAEDALEVGVVSISGKTPNPPKRLVFCAAFLAVASVCGLAAYAYPRDPDFKLSLTGKWLGFVGVLCVLVGAEALVFTWCVPPLGAAHAPRPLSHAAAPPQRVVHPRPRLPALLVSATCVPTPLATAPLLLVACEDGSLHPVSVSLRVALDGAVVRCFTFRCAAALRCQKRLRPVLEARAEVWASGAGTCGLCCETEGSTPLLRPAPRRAPCHTRRRAASEPRVMRRGLRPAHAAHHRPARCRPAQQGLSEGEAEARAKWYGENLIDVPMPSIPRQLADEILNPFMWCARPSGSGRGPDCGFVVAAKSRC